MNEAYTVGRNRSIGCGARLVYAFEHKPRLRVLTLTNVSVRTSTKWEEKMTKKYIAVSLVTVLRMFKTFESQRWVFRVRIRTRTTKNATRSMDRQFGAFSI